MTTKDIIKLTRGILKGAETGKETVELSDDTVVDFYRSVIFDDQYLYMYVNKVEIDHIDISEGVLTNSIDYLISVI